MKDIKKKYWLKQLVWKIFVKPILSLLTKIWCQQHILVGYPLQISLSLSNELRFYYFKYGFFKVYDRVLHYNTILLDRLNGIQDEEILEFYTDEKQKQILLSKDYDDLDPEKDW